MWKGKILYMSSQHNLAFSSLWLLSGEWMESVGLGGQSGSGVIRKAPLPGQGRGAGLDGDSDRDPGRKGGFRVCFGVGKMCF